MLQAPCTVGEGRRKGQGDGLRQAAVAFVESGSLR